MHLTIEQDRMNAANRELQLRNQLRWARSDKEVWLHVSAFGWAIALFLAIWLFLEP